MSPAWRARARLQGDGETAPEFGCAGVEQNCAGVVVAVRAERFAELGVVRVVALRAGCRSAVLADVVLAAGSAGQDAAVAFAGGVDDAERGSGQGQEHGRMGGDGRGDAFASGEPGTDELVSVGFVGFGAGQAASSTPGFAGDGQDAAGFVGGGVTVDQFAGGAVDVIGSTAEQDGMDAAARMTGLVSARELVWCH